MTDKEHIDLTIKFVKSELEGAEAGHDWFHIERVYRIAMQIAKNEKVDTLVVALGALLHDVADSKFHDGNEALGPQIARDFLQSNALDPVIIHQVIEIIKGISFKNTFSGNNVAQRSAELQVVQDADRLDAMGAIGIARAFNFGGYKNRPLYNPAVAPNLKMTKEQYKRSENPTINHFYEKLLQLKDQMNTETGKTMALARHNYMLNFLERFYEEWNGDV
ncbi:MAG: HD domain-containing protein [Flavobacteriaceae bacterium]